MARAPAPTGRLLCAMVLATVSGRAAAQLHEAGLLKGVVEAVTRASRDEETAVRVAAGRAASRLAAGEPSVAAGCVSILVALLGPDQTSGVQQQVWKAITQRCTAPAKLNHTY